MFRRQRELVQNRGLAGRDGARPLQGDRGRTAAGCVGRGFRPTGASQGVHSKRAYLRHIGPYRDRSPPPKPLCGQADSGDRNRSQQRNGNLRPSSSVLGLLQEGGCGPPSWFPALAPEKTGSFFPAACTAGKILLTERRVKGPQPKGWGPFVPKRSAMPLRHRRKGIAPLWPQPKPGATGRDTGDRHCRSPVSSRWERRSRSQRNHLLTMSFFMPLVMPSMESWYMSKCFSSSSKVWVQ